MEERYEEIDEEPDPWYRGPIRYVLAAFLLLLMLVWLPAHYIEVNPHPEYIPTVEEVLPEDYEFFSNETFKLESDSDFSRFIDPTDPIIRQVATKIVAQCGGNKICSTEALYLFVRDNMNYVSDPVNFEYVEDPKEVLTVKGCDCESGTLLLASLLESVGIDSELVLIPGHAFLRAYLPDASLFIRKGDWVYLDWTCSTCDFGDVPRKDLMEEHRYVDLR
ncbi:transglutaminase domain-containing protein [Nanoarchaeota archaeon]